MSSCIKMSVLLFSFAFVSVLSVNIDSEKTDVYVKQNNISHGKPVEYNIEEFNITEPLFIIIPKDRNESFIGPPEHNKTNRKLLEDIDLNENANSDEESDLDFNENANSDEESDLDLNENANSDEESDLDFNENANSDEESDLDKNFKSGNRRLLKKISIKISKPFKSHKTSPTPNTEKNKKNKKGRFLNKSLSFIKKSTSKVVKNSVNVVKATTPVVVLNPKVVKVVSKLKNIAPKVIPKIEEKLKTSSKKVITKVQKKLKTSPKKVNSNNKKVIPKVISKFKTSSKKIISKIKKIVPKVNGIKVYGNFCGPNYCGGQKFKGAEGPSCLWGVSPKDSLDECCKIHDKCCGFSGTRGTNCNKEILSCVKKVKCNDSQCNFSKAIIKTAFSAVKNKVCGDVFGRKKENKSISPKVEGVIQKTSVSPIKDSSNKQTKKNILQKSLSKSTIPESNAPETDNFKSNTQIIKENSSESFSSEAHVKNVLISPDKASNEIHDSITKTNKNLELFKERIISFMTEIEHNEKDVELRNQNNYNDVKSSIEHEESRLEESRQLLKTLYNETESLNITIQTHYKKMISDTEYLKTLDLMRPAFLKSLDEISSHIEAVKNVVDQKLIKDEYKDEMLSLLTGIHFDTHNISGYVATAFINHYNKFKNSIQIEDTTYLTEMKKLTLLSNKYKEQQKQIIELENERARLENILEKLKKTLLLSESQKKEFNIMFNEIISLFNGIQNRCN